MGFSNIVDQDRYIEVVHEGLQTGVIGVVVGGEVHSEGFCLGAGELGFDFLREDGEFGGGAGDEEGVVAEAGEVEGEFFADAIGGAGDQGPGASGAEGAELEGC